MGSSSFPNMLLTRWADYQLWAGWAQDPLLRRPGLPASWSPFRPHRGTMQSPGLLSSRTVRDRPSEWAHADWQTRFPPSPAAPDCGWGPLETEAQKLPVCLRKKVQAAGVAGESPASLDEMKRPPRARLHASQVLSLESQCGAEPRGLGATRLKPESQIRYL